MEGDKGGRGKIYNYGVVYDCPVRLLQGEQPFNVAVIMLDEDPGIQMYSHLPGTPVDEVPVGASVEVVFEATANGQKVPEWRVVVGGHDIVDIKWTRHRGLNNGA